MFYDLNVTHPATAPTPADTASLTRVVDQLITLGYQVCAFNHSVTGKLPQNHTSPIKFLDAFRETAPSNDPPPAPPTSEPPHIRDALLRSRSSVKRTDLLPYTAEEGTKRIRQLSRLTLVAEDPAGNYGFHNSPHLSQYDIVAVQPLSERMLQAVCMSWDVDLISFDMSSRIAFSLKPSTIGLAVDRGIFFELCVGPALKDSGARKYLLSNAAQVVRATKGRNIIVSGQYSKGLEVRGPYDVTNLATLFGLNPTGAKAAVSANCRALVVRAESRRLTHRAAVAVSTSSLPRPSAATLNASSASKKGKEKVKGDQSGKVGPVGGAGKGTKRKGESAENGKAKKLKDETKGAS